MKLWDRIYGGMEAGFDAALAAVHTLTEKAGEGIELTRLRREKARCETRLTRLLAELGYAIYEKVSQERLVDMAAQLGIGEKIIEIAEWEARIVEIDARLRKELVHEDKPEAAAGEKEEEQP